MNEERHPEYHTSNSMFRLILMLIMTSCYCFGWMHFGQWLMISLGCIEVLVFFITCTALRPEKIQAFAIQHPQVMIATKYHRNSFLVSLMMIMMSYFSFLIMVIYSIFDLSLYFSFLIYLWAFLYPTFSTTTGTRIWIPLSSLITKTDSATLE